MSLYPTILHLENLVPNFGQILKKKKILNILLTFDRGLSGPNRPKVLSMMGCFGGESSIFMCRNPGWKKDIPSSCSRPNRDAGVFCYNNGKKSFIKQIKKT